MVAIIYYDYHGSVNQSIKIYLPKQSELQYFLYKITIGVFEAWASRSQWLIDGSPHLTINVTNFLNKSTKIPSIFKSMEQGGIYNMTLTNKWIKVIVIIFNRSLTSKERKNFSKEKRNTA